jgi:glutamate-1-semialdehyde 2,1-aminomutase
MMQVYLIERPSVRTYREALGADEARFSRFAHSMLNHGVFVHPDQFEHWFLSGAHTDEDIDRIVDAAADSARALTRPSA